MNSKIMLALLGLLMVSEIAHAQGLGSIVGRVTDPSGAAIASAKITAKQVGTGLLRSASSDSEGLYVIPSLHPAVYDVIVEASGFVTSKESGITLLADQTLTVNANLKVGAASETIEVNAQNVQVDTATSTVKQVIEQQRINELPLNGRNAAELTLLVPGAVSMPAGENPTSTTGGGVNQGVTKTFPGAVVISTNGARQNQISYQLDGGNNVDEYTNVNQPFPFPDALQEFSVQTSNYSAEYGQNAGGVVNIITRSGSNNFHGDVFEYLRNAVFNAKNFFASPTLTNGAPAKDSGRDQLKRNQFGGTIGGPIIHNRTFFFAGYQGTRFRSDGTPASQTLPSAAQRNSVTDPASLKLLSFIPVGQVTFSRPDRRNTDEVISKVDHSLGRNDRLEFRHYWAHFHRDPVFDPANILTYSDGSTITSQNYLIHESHLFNPSMINDFRFSFSREIANRGPATNVPSVADLGVNIFQPANGKAIQRINVQGTPGFDFGDNPNATFARNNFTWSDDFVWVKGKHNLRFGGVIERSRVDLNNPGFFGYGTFTFSSFANFAIGRLSNFQQGAGEFKNNRGLFAGLYIQDNYKLSRRLTVNLGLRYEPGLPWREVKNRVEQFQLAKAVPGGPTSSQFTNAPPGLFFVGDSGVPKNGVNASLNNFAPRGGFAWDVFGDGKTSLRGGAGIFYDTRITGIINNRMVDLTPFSPQVGPLAPPGPFSDPYCANGLNCTGPRIANPFPISLPVPSSFPFPLPLQAISFDPSSKYMIPTLYNWNLGVEHEFPGAFLARAAYVGSHGTHLKETVQLNPANVGSGASNIDARRRLNLPFPSPRYNNVFMDVQDINSSYNSLQLSLEKRMSRGLTILANYTWSKSIDTLPVGGGVSEIGSDEVSALPWDNPQRHAFDRGPSDFDHTHRFVASYVWQLPRLSSENGLVRGFFGDWQLSGVAAAQTGRPFTAISGLSAPNDYSQTGIGRDRAVLLPGGSPYGSGACAPVITKCVDFLNPGAFAPNTVGGKTNPALIGTFGNVAKGSLRWPDSFNWDMGLSKMFSFTERWKLQFRAEYFNVFNRVNYRSDGSTVDTTGNRNSNSFGRITSADDPRIGQLALKLFF